MTTNEILDDAKSDIDDVVDTSSEGLLVIHVTAAMKGVIFFVTMIVVLLVVVDEKKKEEKKKRL